MAIYFAETPDARGPPDSFSLNRSVGTLYVETVQSETVQRNVLFEVFGPFNVQNGFCGSWLGRTGDSSRSLSPRSCKEQAGILTFEGE
jgi:hypothetical protein